MQAYTIFKYITQSTRSTQTWHANLIWCSCLCTIIRFAVFYYTCVIGNTLQLAVNIWLFLSQDLTNYNNGSVAPNKHNWDLYQNRGDILGNGFLEYLSKYKSKLLAKNNTNSIVYHWIWIKFLFEFPRKCTSKSSDAFNDLRYTRIHTFMYARSTGMLELGLIYNWDLSIFLWPYIMFPHYKTTILIKNIFSRNFPQ